MFITRKNIYIAEAIGTFALVFAGCGAIVVNDLFGAPLGHTGISMVFGLIVMAMIYSIGNISGAHINPAVTLGFFCREDTKRRNSALYQQPAYRCNSGGRPAENALQYP